MPRFRPALTLLACALVAQVAAAPSRYAGEVFPSAAIEAAGEPASRGTGAGWMQTALSLGLVLALVIVMGWLYKRLSTGGSKATGQAATVLGRSAVSPRHGVVLLKVGRRILVCGESAGQPLTTLDSIHDPDEVAELEGNLHRGKGEKGEFLTTLGDARGAFPSPARAARPHEETYPAPADAEVPAAMASARAEETGIQETRSEIADLLEQVRTVSSQLRRTS